MSVQEKILSFTGTVCVVDSMLDRLLRIGQKECLPKGIALGDENSQLKDAGITTIQELQRRLATT